MAGVAAKLAAKRAAATATEEAAPTKKPARATATATATAKPSGSPAQIAARERFAAASKARAAAKAAPTPDESEDESAEAPKLTAVDKARLRRQAAAAAKKTEAEAATKPVKAVKAAATVGTAKATGTAKAAPAKKGRPADDTDLSTKARARAAFEGGQTRRAIADELGVAYATVYMHTKDMEGASGAGVGRARVFVEVPVLNAAGKPTGKTQQVSRSEAMRSDFEGGMSIGDIGRKYGVMYQVAYQACKSLMAGPDEA